jgi:hypothetical protein
LPGDTPATEEEVQVQEQHDAKINTESPDLMTEHFQQSPAVRNTVEYFHDEQGKTKIQQIEPGFKQPVCGVGDLYPAIEDILHKDLTVLEKNMGNIPGKHYHNGQVNQVGGKVQ